MIPKFDHSARRLLISIQRAFENCQQMFDEIQIQQLRRLGQGSKLLLRKPLNKHLSGMHMSIVLLKNNRRRILVKLVNYLVHILLQDFMVLMLVYAAFNFAHYSRSINRYTFPNHYPPLPCFIVSKIVWNDNSFESHVQHQDIPFKQKWLILNSFDKISRLQSSTIQCWCILANSRRSLIFFLEKRGFFLHLYTQIASTKYTVYSVCTHLY